MEQKDQREALTESYAEMNKLRIEEKKNQLATEFARYKQDCRKRALDLAHSEVYSMGSGKNENDVEKLATKYYNWLISIPEK